MATGSDAAVWNPSETSTRTSTRPAGSSEASRGSAWSACLFAAL
jgi:hypothetical protein